MPTALLMMALSACQSSQPSDSDDSSTQLSAAEKTTLSLQGAAGYDNYWLSAEQLPEGWQLPPSKQSSARIEFQLGATDQSLQLQLVLHQQKTGDSSDVTRRIELAVTPVNEAPTALGERFTLSAGDTLSFPALPELSSGNLLLNDRDEPEHTEPSAALRVELVEPPKFAEQFSLGERGDWQYVAAAAPSSLSDSFSYRVSDGQLSSDPVTVELTIAATTNRPPQAQAGCQVLSTSDGFVGALSALASDDEDQPLRFSVSRQPAYGSVSVDADGAAFRYLPSSAERGYRDSFEFAVEDSLGASSSATLSVIVGERRIMPLGDSITFGVEYTNTGGDWPRSANALGYRQSLLNLLQQGGYAVDFVGPLQSGQDAGLADPEHAGFPGWRAADLASGRDGQSASGHARLWLEEHPADVLLVHAGTNDHSPNASLLRPLLDVVSAWAASNNPAMRLLVSSLVPQRKEQSDRAYLEPFNAGVQELVPSYAPAAAFVDQYTALDWRGDISDYSIGITGLHPNTQGYSKMASTWYAALVSNAMVHKCP